MAEKITNPPFKNRDLPVEVEDGQIKMTYRPRIKEEFSDLPNEPFPEGRLELIDPNQSHGMHSPMHRIGDERREQP